MKVLITGANGFLGSHILEYCVESGYEATALLRSGSDLSNIEHLAGRYTPLVINYNHVDQIKESLENTKGFDLIVHNAGLTKSYTLEKYLDVNVKITERLLAVSEKLHPNAKFAYISSLAARGPVGNGGPASNYGISKIRAEAAVIKSKLDHVIFRPGGIYGSRDVQFVPLIKAVKIGLYPLMTSTDHKMVLINAKDASRNIIECSMNHKNEIVHLEDGEVYKHRDLKKNLENILSKKSINLSVPKPIVKTLLSLSDLVNKGLKRTPELSLEHYKEISQDWNFDYSQERTRIPLEIRFPLKEGFEQAIDYYKEKELL